MKTAVKQTPVTPTTYLKVGLTFGPKIGLFISSRVWFCSPPSCGVENAIMIIPEKDPAIAMTSHIVMLSFR